MLPPSRKLRLTDVFIHSDMLLHHPFSQWTQFTLNTASSTITKLSLQLTEETSSTWKIFSATLSFPFLRDFSFKNYFIGPDIAAFVDVEDFLVNHPQIGRVYIHGVGLPPSKSVPRPGFQQLTFFDAHPLYIVWLMNTFILSPNALPALQRVVISADCGYSSRRDFDYLLFDLALESIAAFPRNIALALTFNSRRHLDDWLRSHICAGVEQSVISRLEHVNILSIYDGWDEYTEATIACFPDWLQLFPALRHLKFGTASGKNAGNLTEPKFMATISVLCQKLETIEVDQQTFDLQLVRRNLGNGAGD